MQTATATQPALPPGPRAPVSLQTAVWAARPLMLMERCRERYGDTFTLQIRNQGAWVFISDPEDVKSVFTGDPNVLRAGEGNSILEPVLGPRSVLLLDGPEHMAHRKLMLPPFHGERMQRYGELMEEITRREIASWPVGEPLELWPRMQAITLEIIMRAVFGVEEGQRTDRLRQLLRRMIDWTSSPRRLALLAALGPQRLMGNSRFRAVMDPVDEAVIEEIGRRRNAPDLEQRQDILSMLLQARLQDGGQLSDRELRDELITLLVAGHETTATSLAWAFERLLRHPEKLARLRQELLDGEDAYLDAVIKETLRLRPVLPLVARRLSEPFELKGHLLPADVAVTPCIYLMHRRPDVYPEPESFSPERFLENPAGTYTWIPFGGGVRRCLGASFAQFEMARVLSTVVCETELAASDQRPERMVRRSITLTPNRQARVVVRSRQRPRTAILAAGGV